MREARLSGNELEDTINQTVEREREKRKDSLSEDELELHLEQYEAALRGKRPTQLEEASTQEPQESQEPGSNTAGFDTTALDAIK